MRKMLNSNVVLCEPPGSPLFGPYTPWVTPYSPDAGAARMCRERRSENVSVGSENLRSATMVLRGGKLK